MSEDRFKNVRFFGLSKWQTKNWKKSRKISRSLCRFSCTFIRFDSNHQQSTWCWPWRPITSLNNRLVLSTVKAGTEVWPQLWLNFTNVLVMCLKIFVTYKKYSLTKPLITDNFTSTCRSQIGTTLDRDNKKENSIIVHGGTGCDGLQRLDNFSYFVILEFFLWFIWRSFPILEKPWIFSANFQALSMSIADVRAEMLGWRIMAH